MVKSFSVLERENLLNTLCKNELDVLVIGGGITGAGIALDAVSRGLSTALVEMQDHGNDGSIRPCSAIL